MIAMAVGSACTQVTDQEKTARAALFVMPESEKDPVQVKKTLFWTKLSLGIGALFVAVLLALWVIPYLSGIGKL